MAYKKYEEAQKSSENLFEKVDKIDELLNIGEILITNRQYPAAKEAFNKVLFPLILPNKKAMRYLEKIQKSKVRQ
ncbi:MAG: hypothetical protein MZU97_02140 [Bacillus subtilis]|nr:hypothetical protein [Bacillus subtilis]